MQQTRPGRLRPFSLCVFGLLCVGLFATGCGAETISVQTTRRIPEPTAVQQQLLDPVATTAPLAESTPVPETTDAADSAGQSNATDATDTAETDEVAEDTSEPAGPAIRSFQEFLPDPAAIEERYDDGGLWTLTDIRYLEPGPRVGVPCGDTEPPDFDGIEAVYTNISGENLLVMVQRGEGVEIWIQGVAEGVECTELGIRQSVLTVPGMDQSVVLEIDPAAPAASMAVAGALQDDIFISFIAGAVSPESPVADPNPLIDMATAMFDRINSAG